MTTIQIYNKKWQSFFFKKKSFYITFIFSKTKFDMAEANRLSILNISNWNQIKSNKKQKSPDNSHSKKIQNTFLKKWTKSKQYFDVFFQFLLFAAKNEQEDSLKDHLYFYITRKVDIACQEINSRICTRRDLLNAGTRVSFDFSKIFGYCEIRTWVSGFREEDLGRRFTLYFIDEVVFLISWIFSFEKGIFFTIWFDFDLDWLE